MENTVAPVNVMQVQQQPEWVYLKTLININRKCILYSFSPSYYPVLHRRQSLESRFWQVCKSSWPFSILSLFIACCRTQNMFLYWFAMQAQPRQSYLSKNQERGLRGSQVCVMYIWGMLWNSRCYNRHYSCIGRGCLYMQLFTSDIHPMNHFAILSCDYNEGYIVL